ncbi:MAG: MFS transporter [Thermoplasmata archaeon]|nr:MFS transporter [Thermoplasmata archaeon]
MINFIEKPGKILFITKSIRVFAYGFLSIALPFYLTDEGYNALFVGIFITIGILSSVIYNIFVSKYTEKIGRKKTLQIFSIFMILSSIFFLINNFISILIAAIFGVISVTGTETGPFLSIEQSALTKFTSETRRTLVFSIYNFLGYASSALGSLFSGIPSYFVSGILSLKILIIIYGLIGLLLFLFYSSLKDSLEIKSVKRNYKISNETKKVIIKLSLLFSIDAFGGGFIIQSILSLWFKMHFNMDIEAQSLLFFAGGIITAISFFLAERISRKIGLLNTMVFTHLPSNVFLILVAFSPNIILAITFLLLRQSLSQMDVPTRQSYMMAIVKPEERTAVGAITNIPRSISQAASPYLSTYSISISLFYAPFLISGTLKIIYDILIFITFRKVKPPEEK